MGEGAIHARIEGARRRFSLRRSRSSDARKPPERPRRRKPAPPAARAPVALFRNQRTRDRSSLIPEFSFDGFVAGKANQLAPTPRRCRWRTHPGTSYNPPVSSTAAWGLGKTHLIHRGRQPRACTQHPNARVCYLPRGAVHLGRHSGRTTEIVFGMNSSATYHRSTCC